MSLVELETSSWYSTLTGRNVQSTRTFTDVSLLCAKIGTTSVPMGSGSTKADESRSKKKNKKDKKDRKSTAGHKRGHEPENRNLYKVNNKTVRRIAAELMEFLLVMTVRENCCLALFLG